MTFVETRYAHVVLDAAGVPYIAGTRMKVIHLVLAQKAEGWGPEELQEQFPPLTLGQIYSALAYYWDHQEALDADIERREAFAEEMERAAPRDDPLRTRLRAQG